MKRMLSSLMVLAFVFVVAKAAGPAGYSTFYSYGTTVSDAASAQTFETISEAYGVQLQLGTDWDIITQ